MPAQSYEELSQRLLNNFGLGFPSDVLERERIMQERKPKFQEMLNTHLDKKIGDQMFDTYLKGVEERSNELAAINEQEQRNREYAAQQELINQAKPRIMQELYNANQQMGQQYGLDAPEMPTELEYMVDEDGQVVPLLDPVLAERQRWASENGLSYDQVTGTYFKDDYPYGDYGGNKGTLVEENPSLLNQLQQQAMGMTPDMDNLEAPIQEGVMPQSSVQEGVMPQAPAQDERGLVIPISGGQPMQEQQINQATQQVAQQPTQETPQYSPYRFRQNAENWTWDEGEIDVNKAAEVGASKQDLNAGAEAEKTTKEILQNSDDPNALQMLIEKAKSMFGDERTMLNLAMAFNTLRYQPDQALAGHLSKRIAAIDESRANKQQMMALLPWLEKNRPDLAKAVKSGTITPKMLEKMIGKKSDKNMTPAQMKYLYSTDPAFRKTADEFKAQHGYPIWESQDVLRDSPDEKAYTAVKTDQAKEDLAIAKTGSKLITKLEETDKILRLAKDPKTNIGLFSPTINMIDKLRSKFGDKESMQKVTRREILEAMLGDDVYDAIVEKGIGARGLDTPAELDFIKRVMTGDIDYNDRNAIIALTEMRRRVIERNIASYNDVVNSDRAKSLFKRLDMEFNPIEVTPYEYNTYVPQEDTSIFNWENYISSQPRQLKKKYNPSQWGLRPKD
jgi:hypothetical protein